MAIETQETCRAKNNRIYFIDFLRAACIIYIVGFWHLLNYTQALPAYNNLATTRLTVIILGIFVLMSGYLLAQHDVILTKDSLKRFFIKRLTRVYPPFIFTLCIFLIFHIINQSTAMKAAAVISMFYGPPPPTLWFVTMLLVFYIISPLLISTTRVWRFFVIFAAIFCAFFTYATFSRAGDIRVALYFPAFAIGVYFAKANLEHVHCIKWHVFLLFLAGFAISFIIGNDPEFSFASIPIACLGPALIFLGFHQRQPILFRCYLVQLLSHSSFMMYLLHRPVFLLMKNTYFPSSHLLQIIYLMTVCLPSIVLISWIAQNVYDKIVSSGFNALPPPRGSATA